MKYLLEKSLDVDATDYDNCTSLHIAAQSPSRLQALRMYTNNFINSHLRLLNACVDNSCNFSLLNHGADRALRNVNGETAFNMAIGCRCAAALAALMDGYGASPDLLVSTLNQLMSSVHVHSSIKLSSLCYCR